MSDAVQGIRRRLCRFCRRAARRLRDVEQPRQPAHWCGHGTEVRRGRGAYQGALRTGHEVHDRHVPCRSLVFLSALKEGTLPTPFTAIRITLIGMSRKMKSTRIPVLPITESFPHAWIDRARRFRTAGRKNSRKSWLNAARSDVGRFRVEIHSRGLQARLSCLEPRPMRHLQVAQYGGGPQHRRSGTGKAWRPDV